MHLKLQHKYENTYRVFLEDIYNETETNEGRRSIYPPAFHSASYKYPQKKPRMLQYIIVLSVFFIDPNKLSLDLFFYFPRLVKQSIMCLIIFRRLFV